jgi:hypothetical protein
VIIFKSLVCGTGTRMFTTPAGKHLIRENGLELLVLDPTASPLHCRGDNTYPVLRFKEINEKVVHRFL